jgi:hypothetical protein
LKAAFLRKGRKDEKINFLMLIIVIATPVPTHTKKFNTHVTTYISYIFILEHAYLQDSFSKTPHRAKVKSSKF